MCDSTENKELVVNGFTITAEPAILAPSRIVGTELVQKVGPGNSVVVTVVDEKGVGGQFWMRPKYGYVAINRLPKR